MRNLKRNQRKIYYLGLSTTKVTDEWGNEVYGYVGDPQPLYISVSANTGEVSINGFGTELNYDRVLTTTDKNCPIDEHTKLWINADPTEPHDYEVIQKADSLNQILYAIKRVDVSIEEENDNS